MQQNPVSSTPSNTNISITTKQKCRRKLPNYLHRLLSDLRKTTTPPPPPPPLPPPQPQNRSKIHHTPHVRLLSACRNPRTPSFTFQRNGSQADISNQPAPAATSKDDGGGDPSLSKKSRSKTTASRAEKIRWPRCFAVSSSSDSSSSEEGAVHVCGRGGTVAVTVFTTDPYVDFRRSMLEMMEAYDVDRCHPLDDEDFMQELLLCYLKLNERKLHKHIIDAFFDLTVRIPRNPSRPRNSFSG